MYVNEYTDPVKALELLTLYGSLNLDEANHYPSLNEKTAYHTLLDQAMDTTGEKLVMVHTPSNRMLLRPKVGMGATLHYPSDSYPYEITKVVSNQTLEVRRMIATPVPGWKADFTPGGFCGHIHNLRDQQFTYPSDPTAAVMRIRLNKNGRWKNGYLLFTVGTANYFVDLNG